MTEPGSDGGATATMAKAFDAKKAFQKASSFILVGVVFDLLNRICRLKKNLKKHFDIPNQQKLLHFFTANKVLKQLF